MFFEQERVQFFRPLTGKYRAQIMESLRELHRRLYRSSSADYGQALARDTLLEMFQEALVRAPLLADPTDDLDDQSEGRFRSSREQAVWVLNQLLEYGWIEKQVDQATLQSTFSLTRYGRLFTEPFVHESRTSARTRHRNTRNTRNALEAFLERGDVYDLLDAYEYSERIISDFTDVISELEERKRDLVHEMEDQISVQRASDAFFDFMEHRFQPDLSVRLSADNVEKHRDQMSQIIDSIRQQDRASKAKTERRLRELLPELVQPGQSVLWTLLDGIEQRLRNASDVMLPALRRALQSFTKRADIIIRQMSYLASQHNNDVLSVCQQLASLSNAEQDRALLRAAEHMTIPTVRLLDPAHIRLQTVRQIRTVASLLDEGHHDFDQQARKEIYIQQRLDQAFLVNQQALRQYLQQHLVQGNALSTRQLPIASANDFLAVAHVIGLGASDSLSSEFEFRITPEVAPDSSFDSIPDTSGYFLQKDHFTVELVVKES